jgi:hypothetical protein
VALWKAAKANREENGALAKAPALHGFVQTPRSSAEKHAALEVWAKARAKLGPEGRNEVTVPSDLLDLVRTRGADVLYEQSAPVPANTKIVLDALLALLPEPTTSLLAELAEKE